MTTIHLTFARWIAVCAVLLLAASFAPVRAQQDANQPQIGSSSITTADPPVVHPGTEPCTVQLFSDLNLSGGSTRTFSYAPPRECTGPWAAVIFSAKFAITPGAPVQRIVRVSIGGANLYLGSAPAPLASADRNWSIERNLTDYSAVLETAQSGKAAVDSPEDVSDESAILLSARLEFYRTDMSDPAPRTPDAVLPLGDGAAQLSTETSTLSQILSLPRNIDRAYVDVVAAGEASDETWYLCAPAGAANRTGGCVGDPYREVEISIDGQPAGIAPVYPLISPDGIDPHLWSPIPGVQALGLAPYRADLTPFAGLLSDGEPHQISLGVYGMAERFVAAGSLLLYLDRNTQHVTGGLTVDTLDVAPAIAAAPASGAGARNFTATRQFTIAGYVNTLRGKIETRLDGKLRFVNEQRAAAGTQGESIRQSTELTTTTATRSGGVTLKLETHASYPLRIDIAEKTGADGSSSRASSVRQKYETSETDSLNGTTIFSSSLDRDVSPSDTLALDAAAEPGDGASHSSERYFYSNSMGACYSRSLTAAQGALTGVLQGRDCAAPAP